MVIKEENHQQINHNIALILEVIVTSFFQNSFAPYIWDN